MPIPLSANDSKYSAAFDAVFEAEGVEIVRTPFRAPRANAYAERWVRSVREECLDQLLVLNQTHLRYVLREYERYFNTARPHQGLGQKIPGPPVEASTTGRIKRRDLLGGVSPRLPSSRLTSGNTARIGFIATTEDTFMLSRNNRRILRARVSLIAATGASDIHTVVC